MATQPTVIALLSDVETPVSLFYKLNREADTAFLFESSDGDKRVARFSFMGLSPLAVLSFRDGQAQVTDLETGKLETLPCANPIAVMQEQQKKRLPVTPEVPGILKTFPFIGGWVGYMGYGATHYFDGIPRQDADPLAVPDGCYGLYDTVIVFDHLFRRIYFVSYREEAGARALWETVRTKIADQSDCLPPLFYQDDVSDDVIFDDVSASFTKAGFCDTVRQVKEYISEGQVFQLVLSQRFSVPADCPALDIYRSVQAINPSPYSYFLTFPGFTYLGSSPETFVTCQNGRASLRALAGTRHRGQTDAEDGRLAEELRNDPKELAEHRMLVDLGRNDMGRVCEVGTVTVGEIARLTRYTHVMHLATEITGQLRSDKTAYDVFKSCFPRGTVSGAPKIRAMELLAQLEPERRGIYSGAVGYFDLCGNQDSAIAIRSALVKDGMVHVNAGAGIVYDSVPENEYEETRNKAKSILKAVKIAEKMSRENERTTPCRS